MTLVGALGFMLNRTFSEFDGIKAQMAVFAKKADIKEIKDDLEERTRNADYRQAHEELRQDVSGAKDRVRKIEIKCAANHGMQE